jgi:hypothetical protein
MKKLILIGAIILLSSHYGSAQMSFSCMLMNTCKIKLTSTMLLILNDDGSSQIIFESGKIVDCSHEWNRGIFVECQNTHIGNAAVWYFDGVFLPPMFLMGTVDYHIDDEPLSCNPKYFWGIRRMPYLID